MNVQFVIDTSHGQVLYTIFNLTSLLVVTGIVFYSGARKNYPLTPWLLIILTGGLFYMIGIRVATFTFRDWDTLFIGSIPIIIGKKTILGGIAGLIVGVLLAKWWIGFRAPVLDHYALAMPFFIAFSRIGCLLAGCCYGTLTTLPWGIHYDYKSRAFQSHLLQSKVQYTDSISAAIHPVQVYEIIGSLLITWLVWKTWNKWKAGESHFLFFLICYSVLRFLLEFLRAPEADIILGNTILGLKAVQWVLLACTLAILFILMLRERRSRPVHDYPVIHHSSRLKLIIWMAFLCLLGLLSKIIMTEKEFILILMFLVPLCFFLVVNISLWLMRIRLTGKIKFNR